MSGGSNPYQFRLPRRERSGLVSRAVELQTLRSAFAAIGDGDTQHHLFTGPPRRGKTSLLNVAETEAEAANLLPARLTMSPLLFDSDVGLFQALIDSIAVAIATRATFESSAARHEGVAPPAASQKAFEAIDDARFSCGLSTSLTPALIARDVQKAVELARLAGARGVALLIDDAHFMCEQADHAVLELFDSLLRDARGWGVVLGGSHETADLMRDHSYSFSQRVEVHELGAIRSVFDVQELFLEPGSGGIDAGSLTPEMAFDAILISKLGEPFWLTRIAAALFDAHGKQPGTLTPALIRQVTEEEMLSTSAPSLLEADLARMDALGGVRDDLLHAASQIAPYEGMTLTEYVLAQRLLAASRSDDELEPLDSAIEAAEHLVGELVEEGLVERTDDRFGVAGGLNFQTYLRYAAAERTGGPVVPAIGSSSYGTAAGPSIIERLARELPAVETNGAVATYLDAATAPREPEKNPPRALVALQEGHDALDSVRMASAGFTPLAFSISRPDVANGAKCGVAYVGVVLETAVDQEFSLVLDRVACGWVRWTSAPLTSEELEADVQEWFAARESELPEYRVRVSRVVAGVVPAETAEQLVALLAPGTVVEHVIAMFDRSQLELAADYLGQVAGAFERAVGAPRMPWRYEERLVDAHIRLSFICALLRRPDDAEFALRKSNDIASKRDDADGLADRVLHPYNFAYIRALRGEFAAAAQLARKSAELVQEGKTVGAFMLMFLPFPPTWGEPTPTWNTAFIGPSELQGFIITQALAYEALAGRFSASEFAEAISTLPPRPVESERIIAWIWLTRFEKAQLAADHFELAAGQEGPGSDPEVLRLELDFARRLAS